jgi:hypothetical protein
VKFACGAAPAGLFKNGVSAAQGVLKEEALFFLRSIFNRKKKSLLFFQKK